MKILAISDLHGKIPSYLTNYLENNDIDALIISGDITDFGPKDLAKKILNELSNQNFKVFAIPGNCDPDGIVDVIEESNAINLHKKSFLFNGILLSGFGGSNPTPFNTPTEFTEEDFKVNLNEIFENVSNQEFKANILVTHAPPFNTNTDKISSGDHVGCKSVREAIEKYQPNISLCGHIHEAKSEDKINETITLNPGEIKLGYAFLINFDDDFKKFQYELIELK